MYLFSETYFSAPGENGLQVACNLNCSCSLAAINPVCGEDNLAYFSPCHAGCKNMKNEDVHGSRKMVNFYTFVLDDKDVLFNCYELGTKTKLTFP